MDTWLNWAQSIPNGPLIVLGLPAGPEAAEISSMWSKDLAILVSWET